MMAAAFALMAAAIVVHIRGKFCPCPSRQYFFEKSSSWRAYFSKNSCLGKDVPGLFLPAPLFASKGGRNSTFKDKHRMRR